MTSMFRAQRRNKFGRGVKEQAQRAAAGARARRNGRWTGYRPLNERVRETVLSAMADYAETWS